MKGITRFFILILTVSLLLNIPLFKRTTSDILKRSVYIPVIKLENEWEDYISLKEERNFLLSKLEEFERMRWKRRDSLLLVTWRGGEKNLIHARALALDPLGLPTKIILNKGKDEGIKYGKTVLFHGVLVGKIHHVDSKTSVAITIFNPEFRIAVADLRSGILGVLKGGVKLHLDYIPEDADVKIGDTLVTTGVSDLHPPGVLVGVIKSIKKERRNPLFLNIEVKPFFNYLKGAIFAIF